MKRYNQLRWTGMLSTPFAVMAIGLSGALAQKKQPQTKPPSVFAPVSHPALDLYDSADVVELRFLLRKSIDSKGVRTPK
jgi:hypothetical protein